MPIKLMLIILVVRIMPSPASSSIIASRHYKDFNANSLIPLIKNGLRRNLLSRAGLKAEPTYMVATWTLLRLV